MRYFACLLAGWALVLGGCSNNARLVSTTSSAGVVAVADNSDSWPNYNRSKAMELIKKQCPSGYTILKEEETVVGQTTTNSTQNNTKEVPLMKGVAVDIQQTSHNTTSVRDQTEWRIWYQKR